LGETDSSLPDQIVMEPDQSPLGQGYPLIRD